MYQMIKYPSLVNHYAINEKVRKVQERLDEEFIVYEKIHGANVSVDIFRDGAVYYNSRNTNLSNELLENDSGYKQFREIIPLFNEIVQELQVSLQSLPNNIVRLIAYGEYFGHKVQKMDYSFNKERKRTIKIFDIFYLDDVGNIYITNYNEQVRLLAKDHLVQPIGIDILANLIKQDPTRDSIYGGYNEGLVYKPVESYCISSPCFFIGVKHKTEMFKEIRRTPKIKKEVDPLFLVYQQLISSYLTEQRLLNVLSHGDITLEEKNISLLIKAMQADVKKELLLENEVEDMELFNKVFRKSGKEIVILIKELMLKSN